MSVRLLPMAFAPTAFCRPDRFSLAPELPQGDITPEDLQAVEASVLSDAHDTFVSQTLLSHSDTAAAAADSGGGGWFGWVTGSSSASDVPKDSSSKPDISHLDATPGPFSLKKNFPKKIFG